MQMGSCFLLCPEGALLGAVHPEPAPPPVQEHRRYLQQTQKALALGAGTARGRSPARLQTFIAPQVMGMSPSPCQNACPWHQPHGHAPKGLPWPQLPRLGNGAALISVHVLRGHPPRNLAIKKAIFPRKLRLCSRKASTLTAKEDEQHLVRAPRPKTHP